MGYRILVMINAFLVILFGLSLLFMPAMVLDQFGSEARVPELLLARFFGAALVTVGLVLWFAKDVADVGMQKNLGLALLVVAILVLIVTVIGISPASGVIRSNRWVAMLAPALFAVGYGLLVFLKPRVKV